MMKKLVLLAAVSCSLFIGADAAGADLDRELDALEQRINVDRAAGRDVRELLNTWHKGRIAAAATRLQFASPRETSAAMQRYVDVCIAAKKRPTSFDNYLSKQDIRAAKHLYDVAQRSPWDTIKHRAFAVAGAGWGLAKNACKGLAAAGRATAGFVAEHPRTTGAAAALCLAAAYGPGALSVVKDGAAAVAADVAAHVSNYPAPYAMAALLGAGAMVSWQVGRAIGVAWRCVKDAAQHPVHAGMAGLGAAFLCKFPKLYNPMYAAFAKANTVLKEPKQQESFSQEDALPLAVPAVALASAYFLGSYLFAAHKRLTAPAAA